MKVKLHQQAQIPVVLWSTIRIPVTESGAISFFGSGLFTSPPTIAKMFSPKQGLALVRQPAAAVIVPCYD